MPVFTYTGAVQTWIVPAGVTSVDVECWGAQGGDGVPYSTSASSLGGKGGYAKGRLAVTPGETLYIYVGGQGTNGIPGATSTTQTPGGWNGGGTGTKYGMSGGGGASDVRRGGQALTDRRIVAGGGGGGGNADTAPNTSNGGHGGGDRGQNANEATGQYSGRVGGYGGTQTAGGAAGTNGAVGSLGVGANTVDNLGGGGGGGYYGGGTGDNSTGGGGGSGYVGGVTLTTMSSGVRSGHGEVVISFVGSAPVVSSLSIPQGFDPSQQVTATWVRSDQEGDPQTEYEIGYRRVGDQPWTTVTASGTSTSHTFAAGTFTHDRDYEFRVRSADSVSGWGAYATATASSLDPYTYDPPTTSTNEQATLSSLRPTGTYAYAVRTFDGEEWSEWSDAEATVTIPPTVAAGPAGGGGGATAPVVGESSLYAPAPGGTGTIEAPLYQVEHVLNPPPATGGEAEMVVVEPVWTWMDPVVSATEQHILDTDGWRPDQYEWEVRTFDGEDWSEWSTNTAVFTIPTIIAAPPATGSAGSTAPHNEPSLTMPGPLGTGVGGMDAPGFQVEHVLNPPPATGSADVVEFEPIWTWVGAVVTPVEAGSFDTLTLPPEVGDSGLYEFEVRTFDGEDWSEWSSPTVPVEVSFPIFREVSDSAPATDAVTHYNSQHYQRATDDAAPAIDSVSVKITRVRNIPEYPAGLRLRPGRGLVGPVIQPVFSDPLPGTVIDQVTAHIAQARLAGDSAPATDSADRALIRSRFVDDSVSTSDAAGRSVQTGRTAADAAPATDTAVRSASRSRSATDAASATDSATRGLWLLRIAQEALETSAVALRSWIGSRTAQDSLALGDEAEGRRVIRATASDALAPVTDAVSRSGSFLRVLGDDAPAKDDGVRQPIIFARSGSETISAAIDSASRAGSTFVRAAVEASVAAADSLLSRVFLRRLAADTAPAEDLAQQKGLRTRDVSDTAYVADRADRQNVFRSRSALDAAPLADSAVRGMAAFRRTADSAPALDATTTMLLAFRLAAEFLSLADEVASRAVQGRLASDALTTDDWAVRTFEARRSALDRARATDRPHSWALLARIVADEVVVPTDLADGTVHFHAPVHRLAVQVTITSVSRGKVSHRDGYDSSVVTFTFDKPVRSWAVRANSSSHLDGTAVESWSGEPTLYGLATVPSNLLSLGENRLTIYAQSEDGLWSR